MVGLEEHEELEPVEMVLGDRARGRGWLVGVLEPVGVSPSRTQGEREGKIGAGTLLRRCSGDQGASLGPYRCGEWGGMARGDMWMFDR